MIHDWLTEMIGDLVTELTELVASLWPWRLGSATLWLETESWLERLLCRAKRLPLNSTFNFWISTRFHPIQLIKMNDFIVSYQFGAIILDQLPMIINQHHRFFRFSEQHESAHELRVCTRPYCETLKNWKVLESEMQRASRLPLHAPVGSQSHSTTVTQRQQQLRMVIMWALG